ncbi:MAG: hypothetical protein ABI266_02340 [Ginsengibacter sp.]
MNFENLKIGYVPYSPDLSHPADRRRFPYFAQKNNVSFEIANPRSNYDVILLHGQANLSEWLFYKKKHLKTKFIFEMNDSVIFSSDLFRSLFKGAGRFLLGRERQFYLNYKAPVKKWLRLADLVICSSEDVKKSIQHFNQKIIVCLDYLESEYRFLKKDFTIGDKLKLVWEGRGDVLPHLLYFKRYFAEVSSFCELHIITSEKYPAYGNILEKKTAQILDKLPIKTIFHQWEIDTKDTLLTECDLGIIPLNSKNEFAWHKPANKLISYWFTGLPALVSDTPAYVNMMNSAGEKLFAGSMDEWIAKTHEVKNMTVQDRERLAKNNHGFVESHYSDQALDNIWIDLFNKAADR